MVSCFSSLIGAASEDTAIMPVKGFLNTKFNSQESQNPT